MKTHTPLQWWERGRQRRSNGKVDWDMLPIYYMKTGFQCFSLCSFQLPHHNSITHNLKVKAVIYMLEVGNILGKWCSQTTGFLVSWCLQMAFINSMVPDLTIFKRKRGACPMAADCMVLLIGRWSKPVVFFSFTWNIQTLYKHSYKQEWLYIEKFKWADRFWIRNRLELVCLRKLFQCLIGQPCLLLYKDITHLL